MNFLDFISLWNHPITILNLCFAPLVVLPMTWNFVAPNFVQTDIENFITSSHVARYNVTMAPATVKQLYGILMAIPFVSALLTAPLVKIGCDRYGRRLMLFGATGFTNILASCAFIATPFSGLYELLYVGRILWGCVWSFSMITFPLYIAELSPPELRGAASAMTTYLGALILFFVGVVGLPQVLGQPDTWHIFLALPGIFGIASLICMRLFPETPKYLHLIRHDSIDAKRVMMRFYRGYEEKEVDEAMDQFDRENERATAGVTLLDAMKDALLRRVLIISSFLAISRVTAGGMLVGLYSVSVAVEQLDMEATTAKYISLLLTLVACFGSFLSVWLIELAGRRLLYFGNMAAVLCCSTTFFIVSAVNEYVPGVVPRSAFFFAFVCLLMIAVFFNAGPGTITVFYVAELTPQHARASVTTFTSSIGLLFRLLYFYLFPPLQTAIGPWVIFALLIAPTFLILIYLFFNMPETRGKHVNQILDQILCSMDDNANSCSEPDPKLDFEFQLQRQASTVC